MTLGQNIQNARRAQGLSQEALAEKIGVSRQALGKWEKDTALPGLDNRQALAAALGIGVDALLGAENADPAVPAVTPRMAAAAPISRLMPMRSTYHASGRPIASFKSASSTWETAVGVMLPWPWV